MDQIGKIAELLVLLKWYGAEKGRPCPRPEEFEMESQGLTSILLTSARLSAR
jgi:hypothetical protein